MKETLEKALLNSGRLLLEHYRKNPEFKIKESQSSIVTEADLRSEELILDIIKRKFPDHNLICEESGFVDRGSEFTWVIDPLDGTSNFASSLPWFGVLITLFRDEFPFLAGAYLPVQDTLYFAEKGKGARMNNKPFNSLKHDKLSNSLFAFSVDYTDDETEMQKCMKIYRNIIKASRNIRCTNSLVDFLNVAEGKFGGCINLYTRIWDISGLGLIISESGGALKDLTGEDIRFSLRVNPESINYAVMAGSHEIIEELKRDVLVP